MKAETIQYIFNVLIFAGVLLTAVGGLGAYHFGKKSEEIKEDSLKTQTETFSGQIGNLVEVNSKLNDQLEPFLEYARKLYPNESDSTALDKLRKSIDDTKKDLELEKNTINSLSSILRVRFSGNWKAQPFHPLLNPVNDLYFVLFEDREGKEPRIEFYATEGFNYTKINDHTAFFESRQAVKNGSYPLSNLIQVLDKYEKINFFIPFVESEKFEQPLIRIEEFEIDLIINGKIVKKIKEKMGTEVEVKFYNNSKALAWASIPFITPKNILAAFK